MGCECSCTDVILYATHQPLPAPVVLQSQLCYRSMFVLGNIVVLSVLYSVPGILTGVSDDAPYDGVAEAWLWIGVVSHRESRGPPWPHRSVKASRVQVSSFVAYCLLQGSEPGYISPGAPGTYTGPRSQPESLELASTASVSVSVPAPSARVPESGNLKTDAAAVDGALHAAVEVVRQEHGVGTSGDTGEPHPVDPRIAALIAEHETAAAQAVACMRPCSHCSAQQPPRSHHCRACDKCVATFDHHCTVIGTCIGERNRARFWLFLLAQALSLAVAIAVLRTAFVWRRSSADWVGANILPLLSLIVLAPLQAAVCGLLGFHTWLGACVRKGVEYAVVYDCYAVAVAAAPMHTPPLQPLRTQPRLRP